MGRHNCRASRVRLQTLLVTTLLVRTLLQKRRKYKEARREEVQVAAVLITRKYPNADGEGLAPAVPQELESLDGANVTTLVPFRALQESPYCTIHWTRAAVAHEEFVIWTSVGHLEA